jgi:hypothetical protein
MGKNGRILFDRPKPTAGCSANAKEEDEAKKQMCQAFVRMFKPVL